MLKAAINCLKLGQNRLNKVFCKFTNIYFPITNSDELSNHVCQFCCKAVELFEVTAFHNTIEGYYALIWMSLTLRTLMTLLKLNKYVYILVDHPVVIVIVCHNSDNTLY